MIINTARIDAVFAQVLGLNIFALFAVGVSVHGLFGQLSLVLLLVSIIYLIWKRPACSLNRAERLYLYSSVLFPLAIVGSLFLHGTNDWGHLDNPLRLVLVLPVYFAVRFSGVKIDYLHWGIVVGAIVVGIDAIHQRHVLGIGRVYGHVSYLNFPITFGNMALLLGMLSPLCFSSIYQRIGWTARGLVVLAFGLGVYASLLSGTRGGWISIPFLLLVLSVSLGYTSKRSKIFVVLASMMIIVGAYYLIPSVSVRVDSALNEIIHIYSSGSFVGASVGTRLEMWYTALLAFMDSPFLGLGLGNYYEFKFAQIDIGEVSSGIRSYHYAHNEPLHYLAEMGLLGFIPLMLVYASWLAMSLANQSKVPLQNNIALMGLMIVLLRFDIGLTQVQFVYHFTSIFYIMLFAIVAGFMSKPGESQLTQDSQR